MNTLIKCIILAWGIPLVISIVAVVAMPDPNRPETDFPFEIFTPTDILSLEKKGSKGRDHFELWLHHPEGHRYYHRDPEPEPIRLLDVRIPRQVPLKVIYTPSPEGNVLLSIAPAASLDQPAMSFQQTMAQYAHRRRVIFIVAGLWFALAHLILFALWKMAVPTPKRNVDDPSD